MRKSRIVSSLAVAAVAAVGFLPKAKARVGGQTLQNLQSAYNGESNARARYLAFAQQADKEGYLQVAALFRAAARAEQIHLTNHAAVIKQLGAIPKARIEKPVVRSTRENLDGSASKGEAYERDTMYPAFIKTAEHEGLPAAVKTFQYAQEAEAEHYNLFAAASDHLDQMRSPGVVYYACSVSGYTSATRDRAHCPAGEYEPVK